jgi:hypothetical protein
MNQSWKENNLDTVPGTGIMNRSNLVRSFFYSI